MEVPNLSLREVVYGALLDLIEALKKPHPATLLQVGNKQLQALETLAKIFCDTCIANGEILAPPRVEKLKRIERTLIYNIPLPRVLEKTTHTIKYRNVRNQ